MLLAFFSFAATDAQAATGHSLLRTISTGAYSAPKEVSLDSDGNVYVMVIGGPRLGIKKFDSNGNPVPFSASTAYINGNKITGTPAGPFYFQYSAALAVDRSGGPTDGYIYVVQGNEIETSVFVFDATGAYKGKLGSPPPNGNVCGVAVDQASGSVYVSNGSFGGDVIRRYAPPTGDPATATPTGTLKVPTCNLTADSGGNVYVGWNPIRKYLASQFGQPSPSPAGEFGAFSAAFLAVNSSNDDFYVDDGTQIVRRNSAGVVQGSPFGPHSSYEGLSGLAIDDSGNAFVNDKDGGVFVYGPSEVQLPTAVTGDASAIAHKTANVEGSVDPDSAGNITGCEFRFGPDTGYSHGSAPCVPAASPGTPITSATPVTAALSGLSAGTEFHYRLFVTNANGTNIGQDRTFTTPVAVDGVTTLPATGVGKDAADLRGSFEGDGQETHYYFEWGPTVEYGQVTPVPPGSVGPSGVGTKNVAPIHISGLKGTTTYHYRLIVSNADGTSWGQDETFTTAEAVTKLTADPPSGVTNEGAELHGSFDGDSYETDYYFEWGPTVKYGKTAPVPPGNTIAPGTGRISVPAVPITGLQEGGTYHYRIVATNDAGKSVSADASFKAAEPPIINNLRSRSVKDTSAEITAELNPRYGHTTYRFEWGPTIAYGNSIPVSDGDAGSGGVPIEVSAKLDNLASGETYHFRLVATNEYGTVTSPNQTFGFYPPACPNAQVRQETRSSTLPDCRAYELVTPSFARGTMVFPSLGPPTSRATSPSRIAYVGVFGTYDEGGTPVNMTGDLYVASRTPTGWKQRFIGIEGDKGFIQGSPPRHAQLAHYAPPPNYFQDGTQASPDFDQVINYQYGWTHGILAQIGKPSNSPFVWNPTTGEALDRWPTNVNDVEGGTEFVGTPRASADFSHFVFSSNVVFADGGIPVDREIACCFAFEPDFPPEPAASIYDNDVETREVVLASVTKAGVSFEGHVIDVSEDGTRILMSKDLPGASGYTGPLYLRVDASDTLEILPGKQFRYVGGTADGKTIYLTSFEQLTDDDDDSSRDLFAWRENDPDSLERISVGSGGNAGNTDDCDVAWNGGGCNIRVVDLKSYAMAFLAGQSGNGESDDFIASESGDIYFESPEQLAGAKGDPGLINLYVYRHGTVRFVAAMEAKPVCTSIEYLYGCSSGPVARMQVTPDGDHMALITSGHLTGYDSGDRAQMYLFDANTGRVSCASCRTDGKPPKGEVLGSQNGLFLTDDGRVFFGSGDDLVPKDTDGIEDIYEYTEGKASLISGGLGTTISGLIGHFNASTAPGLISVSANGLDVYFATIDSLVTQDQNGAAIKIYNARTGGGFPAVRTEPNCAAADECHGPSSSAPALPPDRTSAKLGAPKSPVSKRKAQKNKKRKKKNRAKARQRKAAAKARNGRSNRG